VPRRPHNLYLACVCLYPCAYDSESESVRGETTLVVVWRVPHAHRIMDLVTVSSEAVRTRFGIPGAYPWRANVPSVS
jgi:hypothetical protein